MSEDEKKVVQSEPVAPVASPVVTPVATPEETVLQQPLTQPSAEPAQPASMPIQPPALEPVVPLQPAMTTSPSGRPGFGVWSVLAFILILVVGLVFWFTPVVKNENCFSLISQIKSFSESLEKKKIEMENKNLLKPVYDQYYLSSQKSSVGTKLNSWLVRLKLRELPAWSPACFCYLLSQVISLESRQTLPKSDFVTKCGLASTGKIIVLGELQGSFDSLVRSCEKLKDLGVLDDSLKLKSQADMIVLMGDVVSRSPYQLETLSLVFRLIINNPSQIIYIKGNHETDNYWQEFNLKSELIYRAGPVVGFAQALPLEKEINMFFASLPVAAYFSLPGSESLGYLRISHYGADRSPLFAKTSENKLSEFLLAKPTEGKLESCSFASVREKTEGKDIPIKAIIKGERKRDTYQDMDGLRLLPPEDGVTAWTVLSCPNEVYQKGLKFFFDSFVLINFAGKDAADSKLTLFKQDVRSKGGFVSREQLLLSGKGTTDVAITPTVAVVANAAGEKADKPAEKQEAPISASN